MPNKLTDDQKALGPRIASLDNLRGFAILLVLGAHVPAPQGETGFALLVRAWQQVGWIGVDLFFTLSGFLVGGLLFKSWKQHGRLLAGRFLLRRAFKIYPAFYTMLGLMLLCKPQYFDRSLLLSELFFLQNYWVHFLPHSWTLAVEEHFYIFLPLLLFTLRGRKEAPFARLPFVFCLIAITCLSVRVWMIWAGGYIIWDVFLPTHLRVDSLLAGVLVAWIYHFHGAALASFATRWKKRLIQAALILASPPLFWTLQDQSFVYTFGLTGMWLAASMAIIVAIHTQSRSGVL